MELSRNDTKMTQGLAIIFMVLLHLFCRKGDVPYDCFMIGSTPLVYYFALIADCCVAIYCFCSGYAIQLINDKSKDTSSYYKGRLKSIFKLLINYWIVLIIFVCVGLITKNEEIPGSIKDFVLHFFLIKKSYNGAWWFLLTYIWLILFSRPLFRVVEKIHPVVVNGVLFVLYFIAYYQRLKNVIYFDNECLNWILNQVVLFFVSVMPFVWGMYFFKYKIFSKIRNFIATKNISNYVVAIVSMVVFLALVFAHGIVQNEIVQPFTGLVIVVIFNIVKKGKVIDSIFLFLGKHSTNIWLTHMFFYSVLFTDLVFIAKYPIAIFAFMMALTIGSSYIIDLINKPLGKLVK